MLISAERGLTPDGRLEPLWLRVQDGRIAESGTGTPPGPADLHHSHGVLSPGFVDVHCHGGGGADFTQGAEGARTVRSTHLAQGTTTMLASLVSAPQDVLLEQIKELKPLVDSGELAGVHLEGPWLAPGRSGAHDPEVLVHPETAAAEQLLGQGAIRMVTIAPELPGALETISAVSSAGAVAAVGHTDADYRQAQDALAAGATAGTHLFNAMAGLHHREPGPIPALLEAGAWLELIADGVHLHPAVLNMVFTAAPEKTVLVSDAMAAAGIGDGDYTLGGLEVRVADGEARLRGPDGAVGAIAGSTLSLSAALRHSVLEAGVPTAQALQAATAHPARMIGLSDTGALSPGNRADLVLLNDQLLVEGVMRAGQWVSDGQDNTDPGL